MSERTLRDEFAMFAMLGIVMGSETWTPGKLVHEDVVTEDAYAIADEMMKVRDEPIEKP